MNEDIVDGYRLTKIPHKRPEYYFNSIGTYLRTHLSKSHDESDFSYNRRSDSKKNSINQKKSSSMIHSQNIVFSNEIESNLRQSPESVEYGHIGTDLNSSIRNDSFNDKMKKIDLSKTSHEINTNKPKLHTKHQSQNSLVSNCSSKLVILNLNLNYLDFLLLFLFSKRFRQSLFQHLSQDTARVK